MKFNSKQVKFLKRNVHKLSLEQIVLRLGAEKEEVLEYLKKRWDKKRFEAFVDKHKEHEPGRFWDNFLFVLGILVFLILAVYVNSLGNDFVSDDIPGIVNNPEVGNLSFVFANKIFVGSMRYLYQFVVFHLFGLLPWVFRLGNIFFHIGSASFVYLIVRQLKSARLAFVSACIFAVHPILTESVSWISGGGYAQSSFFLLLSFWTYLKIPLSNKYYVFSLVSFLLSVGTNVGALALPLFLSFYEFSLGNLRKNWKKLLLFFILSGVMVIAVISKISERQESLLIDHYQTGGLHNPLIQIPVAITTYIQLLFFPLGLTLYHSELSLGGVEYALRVLGVLSFFIFLFWNYKKNRWIFFWLVFFIISLLPALTPLKVASVVAERYVYLGSLGIIVVVAYYIDWLIGCHRWRSFGYGLFVCVVILLSIRTVFRNMDWRSQDSLWIAAAKTSPSSHNNHNNLGDMYARKREWKKAEAEFLYAIELKPNYADAYHNLGNTYMNMGENVKAEINFRRALELNPYLWQSHRELAVLYYKQGKVDLAKTELEAVLKIDPSQADVRKALESLN